MTLSYRCDHLSIKAFEDTEINDFSVITGLNGSGKSHLLNAIDTGAISITDVDIDEIILYNYADFNVFNFEINHISKSDSKLFYRQEAFQNKSSKFTQKINEKKNQILLSFKIPFVIGNITIQDHILNNIHMYKVFEWKEEDFISYEQINPENLNVYSFPSEKHGLLHSFVNDSSPEYLNNIREFITRVQNLFFENLALNLLRDSSFSLENFLFEDSDINIMSEVIAKEGLINIDQFILENQLPTNFSTLIYLIGNRFPKFDFQHLKILIKNVSIVHKKILDYFTDSLGETTVEQFKKINGDINLFKNIEVESGLFNLKELEKQEKLYQLSKKHNEYQEFLHSKDDNTPYYSNQEFLDLYGESPLSSLNSVLEEYDCNGYEFRSSELRITLGTDINQQNIIISLYNKIENFTTNLESLSSGEKTLLALAFSIYKLRKNKIIAKVFLMDELDSALHPLMSKRLINVLYNYFHKRLGIKIIISTHSPSTVAFAPEKCLLIMRKAEFPRLIKVNKDKALKELTIGVPSFSINYENRRQVFVESQYDAEYYESMYNIFKPFLSNEISLNFIASGDVQKDKNGQPKNNCNMVETITNTLNDAGNNSIFGIIDWDLKETLPKNHNVKVLGFGKRYSIENFLLDPLLVGLYLIKEKIYKPEYFGLNQNLSLGDLLTINAEECQKIINKVEKDFAEKTTLEKVEGIDYLTINNLCLQIPDFIAKTQGHKLEMIYKKLYPQLNAIASKGENHLKNTIISKVIEDFTPYAPQDLLHILASIQEI